MKYIIIVAALILSACASSTPNPIQKTSDGVIANPNIYHIVGKGKSFEEAKNNGFTRAIEYVVGSVVLSTTASKNDKLVRDDILTHSSGYIDDYTIISTNLVNGVYSVEMNLTVKSSRIANRLLGKFDNDEQLPGERLATQYLTYMRDRSTGDALIKEVIGDYPKNAFIVTNKGTEFKVRTDRIPILVVSYNLKWNRNYVTAMREMFSIMQDGENNKIEQQRFHIQYYPNNNNWIGSVDHFYFNDHVRANQIRQYLSPPISIMATISDDDGHVLMVRCSKDAQYMAGAAENVNPTRMWTGDQDNDTIEIVMPKHQDLIRLVNNVKLEAVSEVKCRNEMIKTM